MISQKLDLLLEPLYTVLFEHHIVVPLLPKGPSHLVHGGADALVEVGDLVEEKSLEELHLPLNVTKVTLIYLGQDSGASIIDGSDRLLLDVQDLSPHRLFKVLQLPLVHDLSLQLQLRGPRPQKVKQFLVNICAHVDKVKLVRLVMGPRTL